MLSIFVVSAASIAFPAVPFSGAMPQPSWTLTLEVRKINDGEENYTDIRHTLFFTVATIVVDGKGSQRTEVVVRKDSDSNRTPIDIYFVKCPIRMRTEMSPKISLCPIPFRGLIHSYHVI